MSNPNKQRGSAFESALAKYLRERGHDAERLALRGNRDEGDLVLRLPTGDRFVIEAKATARIDLAGWVAQAEAEVKNYGEHRGIMPAGFAVVYKRRGYGIGQSYVIMPLDEWISQVAS